MDWLERDWKVGESDMKFEREIISHQIKAGAIKEEKKWHD